MNHKFIAPAYNDTKCIYCEKTVKEIIKFTIGAPIILENIKNCLPCLSDEEYIIKQIIE